MLYRLAIGTTRDGYLQVTAHAKDAPDISAIHLNVEVFAGAVIISKIAPSQTLRILAAARQAVDQPGVDVCCEAVELNETQVERLRLQPGRKRIA